MRLYNILQALKVLLIFTDLLLCVSEDLRFAVLRPRRAIFPHSLDFNKGAALPPCPSCLVLLRSPPPFLLPACCTCCHSASSGCCGARLGPNTIPPAPDAVGHAWARTPYRQLQMLCGARLGPNTIRPAPDVVGGAWSWRGDIPCGW